MGLTENWFCRQAWRRLAGQPEDDPPTPRPDLEDLRATQWNDTFERLMRNRLVMGAFRYGTFSEQAVRRFDNMNAIQAHLDEYQRTGNAEHLVDIANLALVEFTRPFHPRFHFFASDDGPHATTKES